MKKTLLYISICFTPAVLAIEYSKSEPGISLPAYSTLPQVKFSVQNHSIKDLSDFHSSSISFISFSRLNLRKTWSNYSEWKLYSNHIISSPWLSSPVSYSSQGLGLGHNTSGFSLNNRLSLRKRYSNAFILTPTIGLDMLSAHGHITRTINTNIYPLPIQFQSNIDHIYSFNTGIDLAGHFTENWGYSADLEYSYLTNTSGTQAWKSEALFFYQWQTNSKVFIGYKYIDGQNNNQHDVQLYPVIDVLWAW